MIFILRKKFKGGKNYFASIGYNFKHVVAKLKIFHVIFFLYFTVLNEINVKQLIIKQNTPKIFRNPGGETKTKGISYTKSNTDYAFLLND
jgi:hypothetical protein